MWKPKSINLFPTSFGSPFITKLPSPKGKLRAIAMSYERELKAAKEAAALAARLCQNVQRTLLKSDVQSKSDKSPVTIADYGSQAIVSIILQQELPAEKFSLVAEEDAKDLREDSATDTLLKITSLVNDVLQKDRHLTSENILTAIDCGNSEGGPIGRHWVLDPIDGTKGFVRGDQYAIALALLDEGKVVLGVLACPNLPMNDDQSSGEESGCLFYAVSGLGTWVQSLNGSSPRKVEVSAIGNPKEASLFESFEAAHSQHGLSKRISEKLGVEVAPVRMDSQVKYGALSRGDGVIFMRFPYKGYREKIWDHAAGYIVVQEAGGLVLDAAGNHLDFSKGIYLDADSGIISTNKNLMPALLQAVRDSIHEQRSNI